MIKNDTAKKNNVCPMPDFTNNEVKGTIKINNIKYIEDVTKSTTKNNPVKSLRFNAKDKKNNGIIIAEYNFGSVEKPENRISESEKKTLRSSK